MTSAAGSTRLHVGRGVLASLVGTAAMTVFQKLVEMPVTGRAESYAPADFAEKVFPVALPPGPRRRGLNYGTHFALGTLWGAALGLAADKGLRGAKATAVAFGVVYTGDVALNTALGLYKPGTWTRQDWAVDVVDKLVQAAATSAVLDRWVDPAG